ncbi:hypothetical protein DPMN_157649 [Dreissena polymorpha]|uniref:Uncharacterized protein n=1 Tax=Dreissena polymorpha TaxID=45954 RepID=A0A9D4IL87_DREPO|nr:hypothetical protein DPMN_157649 [Dreissena polymorpha]
MLVFIYCVTKYFPCEFRATISEHLRANASLATAAYENHVVLSVLPEANLAFARLCSHIVEEIHMD